jgi:hypothetical protein
LINSNILKIFTWITLESGMMIGLCTDIFFHVICGDPMAILDDNDLTIVDNDSGDCGRDDDGEKQGVTCERYSR